MQSAWQPQFGTFATTWAALNTPMMNNMIAPTGGQFVYTAGSQRVVPSIMLMPQQTIDTSTAPVVNLTEAGTLETLMDPGALRATRLVSSETNWGSSIRTSCAPPSSRMRSRTPPFTFETMDMATSTLLWAR